MDKLGSLAVAGNYDLGRRALADGLYLFRGCLRMVEFEAYSVDQIEHGGSTVGITAGKEADDVGWVGDALDCQTAGSTQAAGKSVEEDRAFAVRSTDVTLLGSATSPDDSNSAAGSTISQLVVGVAVVLTLGEGRGDLLRYATGLKRLSILLDGETSVYNISDGKADAFLGSWCWGSEDCAKQSSEREDGLDLHLELRAGNEG